MASAKTAFGLIAVAAAVVVLSVNNTFAKDTPGGASAAKVRVVTVTAEDFKFDAPDEIPAGLTEFRLLNKGPALHHMAVLKLTSGKTIDDLRAALANPGPPPSWIKEMGGPNAVDPGLEGNATIRLEPGNYALICFVDLGGPPHFTKGMLRGLRVVPSKGAVGSAPKADATIDLFDYNFKVSSPIRAGTRTIKVHNTGKQVHEVELVQLAPGATVAQLMAWMGKMEGPPPGKALGGVAGMQAGMSEYFSADFAPGNYALICFVSDAKDGKPHFAHGMVQQITVN